MNNKKYLPILFGFFCFGILCTMCMTTISAQGVTTISLVDESYEVYKIEEKGGQTIVYYNISITLENSATEESDDITLEIVGDDDIPLYKNSTIPAGGQWTFTWEKNEYFIAGAWDHYINISYYSTNNPNIKKTDRLNLAYQPSTSEGTPGFEAFLTLILLSLFVLIKKVRK